MAPAIERVQLGATTPARKWWVDVAEVAEDPTWIGFFGVTEFTPGLEGSLQDDSDYDGGGWGSQMNTRNSWNNEATVKRAPAPNTDPPVYDPGQELVRLAAARTGAGNEIMTRWYEMSDDGPRVEAYQGRCSVTWAEQGGGTDALSTASVTFAGRGRRIPITHPASEVVPT